MATNMPWFKIFTECRTDRKLTSLNDHEFRTWFNLLCYASEQETRGQIIYDDIFTLAIEVCSGDCDLLNTTIDKLIKLHIVTTCNDPVTSCNELKRVILSFIHYEDRQKRTIHPSDSPEEVAKRVKKFRNNGNVTSNSELVTNCNDPETSVTSTDLDLEEDLDKETDVVGFVSNETKEKRTIIQELWRLMGNTINPKTQDEVKYLVDDYGEDKVREAVQIMLDKEIPPEFPMACLRGILKNKRKETSKPASTLKINRNIMKPLKIDNKLIWFEQDDVTLRLSDWKLQRKEALKYAEKHPECVEAVA